MRLRLRFVSGLRPATVRRTDLPTATPAAYVIVDIQIIGRKPHAPTGLDGWIVFKNKAICERSNSPHRSSFPEM